MKYISIIGSTGSIGTQTLELVRANKNLGVTALAAGSNVDLFTNEQIREFHPHTAVLYDEQRAEELRLRCKGSRSAGSFTDRKGSSRQLLSRAVRWSSLQSSG